MSLRYRILAGAAALGVAVGLLPAAPAAAAEAPCTAVVSMVRWGGPWAPNTGIVANFDVTNNTIVDIASFRISFVSRKVITAPVRWGQTMTYRSVGSRSAWAVTPHEGNPDLTPPLPPEDPAFPPGRTIEFGFQGELLGQITDAPHTTAISSVSVVGRACEVVYVDL